MLHNHRPSVVGLCVHMQAVRDTCACPHAHTHTRTHTHTHTHTYTESVREAALLSVSPLIARHTHTSWVQHGLWPWQEQARSYFEAEVPKREIWGEQAAVWRGLGIM